MKLLFRSSILVLLGFVAIVAFTNDHSVSQHYRLQPQLRESISLIGADRVWTELGITGKDISVVVIDDISIANNDQQCVQLHGLPVSEIVHAVAPDATVLTYDLAARWDEHEGSCVFTNVDDGLQWAIH